MRAILLLFTATAWAAMPTPDACALLSSPAIQKILGESVKSAKPSAQIQGEVRFSQCFYTLQTFTNSVSLALAAPSPADLHHDAARELWQHWFHKGDQDPDRARDSDAGQDKSRAAGESEEEEAAAKATPVPGLGAEAFWVQSFVGNLYVRKGDEFVRISIGGKQNDAERLAKAKALAAEALRHMP